MDLSWLVRLRWRLAGAWMWPAFVVLAVADGFIGHALPLAGSTESVVAGLVLGLLLNLLAVAVVGPLVGRALRRRRRDLPAAIARDYGGTACLALVTGLLIVGGVLHRPTIAHDRALLRDAAVRAAAWIGAHAPPRFRADADTLDSYVLLTGRLYRECATASAGGPPVDYCVVVNERRQTVRPAGSESNETLSRGDD